MWSHGTGAEVMQRIAVPMIGGMISSTFLTLIVIPAIYAVVKSVALRVPSAEPALQQTQSGGSPCLDAWRHCRDPRLDFAFAPPSATAYRAGQGRRGHDTETLSRLPG